MENTNQFLGTERVGKLMRRYAVPCIISLLVGALYNIVDQIFIANASYLGSYGNAANTVVFPLTVVALAIAVMIGDGCCAFVSISLGKGEVGEARKSVGSAVVLSVASSLVLTALYLIFADAIISMFGGTVNEETFHYAQEYFFYISLGIPFYMFGQAMNPVIRADGNPRFAMISTLAGAVLNIILDPIFIFECKWGMMGAAVATVIGQCVAGIVAGTCNHKYNHDVSLSFKGFRPDIRLIGHIYAVGIPSIIMQSIGSIMTYSMNRILIEFSSTATAVFGVYFKLQSFFFMPVFGLNNGITPIIAYNYGAQQRNRMIKTIRISLTTAFCLTFIGFLCFEGIPQVLLGMFNASDAMLKIGVPALRIIGIHYLIAWFCIIAGTVFQALGKAVFSMVVSIMRQLVVLIPSAYILSKIGGLHIVWWAFPIAEVISFIVSTAFLIKIYKTIISKIPEGKL